MSAAVDKVCAAASEWFCNKNAVIGKHGKKKTFLTEQNNTPFPYNFLVAILSGASKIVLTVSILKLTL